MLRNMTWDRTDTIIRAQFALFDEIGDQLRLTEDDRRFLLDLEPLDWAAWSRFVAEGPMPASPTIPEMLRRLAETIFTLSIVAERRA